MSKRGQTLCPGCHTSFNNRYKPETCDTCNYFLGGSYKPKEKKAKLYAPEAIKLFTTDGCWYYSVKTHSKDSRCIAIVDEKSNLKQCLAAKCKEVRAAYVNSGRAEQFTCEHTAHCKTAVMPMEVFKLTDSLIESYPCDQTTKDALFQLKEINSGPDVYKVSSISFCVYGETTASNPVGFCHVKNANSTFVCTSPDCGRFASKTKSLKHKKICMHVHLLLCVLQLSKVSPSNPPLTSSESSPDPTTSETSEPVPGSSSQDLPLGSPVQVLPSFTNAAEPVPGSSSNPAQDTSATNVQFTARQSTIKLNMQHSLPYSIPHEVLHQISVLNSKSILHGFGVDGWPVLYQPNEDLCGMCGTSLSSARPHPGQKKGESGFLITNAVFGKVTILVKNCSNCKAIVQVFPYDLGLFNISDKLLVSLDILIEWREEFMRGVPPTVAVEHKLATLFKKCAKEIPASTTVEYFYDLLYNGFYCFEAITERTLDEAICGICGVVGEVYFGDGNEKNCCCREEISYKIDDSVDYSQPMSLEYLLEKIKYHWVELTTFTRCSEPFSVEAFSLPPIIAPKLRGKAIFNTEVEKKTNSVNKGQSSVKGDPALLHMQIRDFKVNMQSLEKLSLQDLRELCKKCDIPVTANTSQQALRGDLQQLYATLLLGNCPCHGFTKVPGKTGGFYHLVCRHGVTVASKFLTIQESVRDAADLYLSLKYPPPTFICDTPCGFVRHMDCRDKDIAYKLWGNNSGCFEVPSMDKLPKERVNVPEIVPAEFKMPSANVEGSGEWVHPISGSSRRYILGDRFHSATNPHKSALCKFHDINLCLQANAIRTSYQEAENSRKNKKRLKSACVQNFGTHFFFNFLMDFYQNEMIIQKQLQKLQKALPNGFQIKRDKYMRFVYEPIQQ